MNPIAHLRSRVVAVLIASALLAVAPPAATAHAVPLSVDAIEEGRRLRVSIPSLEMEDRIAYFAWAEGVSVALDLGGRIGRRAVARDEVSILQASEGEGNRMWAGLLFGGLAGLGVGVLTWGGAEDDPPCRATGFLGCWGYERRTSEDKRNAYLGGWVVGTGLFGFLVGKGITFERWRSVEVGGRTAALRPLVRDGRAGLALRIVF